MELKLKYLFIKKNLIRSNVRKLKALIKLYTDYIEYITVDYKEKLDKKVLKFKTKQYQIFQNTYYNHAEEKELFDVVYNLAAIYNIEKVYAKLDDAEKQVLIEDSDVDAIYPSLLSLFYILWGNVV